MTDPTQIPSLEPASGAGRARGRRGNQLQRRLDAVLGPALLRLLGALRPSRARPVAPGRIGVMKTTGIGDMVLAAAVVADLRRAYPDAELVVFAGPGNAAVARLMPGVTVVALPTARPWKAIPLIRAARVDLLIDLGQWTRLEAIYSAFSRARWTAGFRTPGFDRHYAYDASAPHRDTVRELENYRALTELAGARPEAQPRFEPNGEPPAPPLAGPYVIFHLWPGGFRSQLREWPADRWRALADRVRAAGYGVVLTGGPEDIPRAEAFARDYGAPDMVSIAGRDRFDQLLHVLRGASCVVSVNTGLMHLAAATGAATVGLNGPTADRRWGPVGEDVIAINSSLPGCGFLNLGFEYDGQRTDCMDGIDLERVAAVTLSKADARRR